MNLLRLSGEVSLGRGVTVKAATISALKTRDEPLVPDRQTFSNIEIDNLPIALSRAGVEWGIDSRNTLFVGIDNINDDAFASPVTTFFTNSSCGIYPTLSCNYPLPNFPVAALGVRYRHDRGPYALTASAYNGTSYNKFAGRGNVFRFCPHDDGLYAQLQGEWNTSRSSYYLGGCMRVAKDDSSAKWSCGKTLWAYSEQQLSQRFALLCGYSHAFRPVGECTDFAGVGGKFDLRHVSFGLFSDYAYFVDGKEWATEFTMQWEVSRFCYIQPTLHLVTTDGNFNCMGLLRVCLHL